MSKKGARAVRAALSKVPPKTGVRGPFPAYQGAEREPSPEVLCFSTYWLANQGRPRKIDPHGRVAAPTCINAGTSAACVRVQERRQKLKEEWASRRLQVEHALRAQAADVT